MASKGKLAAALDAYQASLDITSRLAKTEFELQASVAAIRKKIGSVLRVLGRFDDALREYRLALTVEEELAGTDPKDLKLQGDVAFSYKTIGGLLAQLKQWPDVITAYRSSLANR